MKVETIDQIMKERVESKLPHLKIGELSIIRSALVAATKIKLPRVTRSFNNIPQL